MPIPDVDEPESEPTPEPKYITLHLLGDCTEIITRADKICSIRPAYDKSGSVIECDNGRAFNVRESYEDVQKMIGAYKND